VTVLAVEYAKYRLPCGKQKNEWFQIQKTLREVRSTYGDLLASEFGPLLSILEFNHVSVFHTSQIAFFAELV
jgi:hypothetical protein